MQSRQINASFLLNDTREVVSHSRPEQYVLWSEGESRSVGVIPTTWVYGDVGACLEHQRYDVGVRRAREPPHIARKRL
jgi:hypothetical protein